MMTLLVVAVTAWRADKLRTLDLTPTAPPEKAPA